MLVDKRDDEGVARAVAEGVLRKKSLHVDGSRRPVIRALMGYKPTAFRFHVQFINPSKASNKRSCAAQLFKHAFILLRRIIHKIPELYFRHFNFRFCLQF